MLSSAIQIFILLTPFFVLSVFVTMTEGRDLRGKRHIAVQTATAILVIDFILYFLGNRILQFLGITLDAFRVGAGLVLLLGGLDLVRGGGRNGAAPERVSIEEDIAIVPLAIPCAIGPGTIGAILVMGNNAAYDWGKILRDGVGMVVAAIALCVILYYADLIERLVRKRGLVVLSKLTGLFLAALSAQIMAQGLRNLLWGAQ
ncbi:MAG: MarC family protein [Victivallaceae bacterium]|nr:MarC family protein [Victivallaceae bacterium]